MNINNTAKKIHKGRTRKKHTSKKHTSKKHTSKKHTKKKNDISDKKKKKFIVGIVSVPLTPEKKYFKVCGDSYIASSHLKWLKSQDVETLIIPYNTKDIKYYFSKVQGLYLPSGGAFASNQTEYYKCCKKLIQMAMKENDKGNYFPIWGCCMGFQQMLIIADGNDDLDYLLTKFDSFNNLLCNIDLTEDGKNSTIMNGLDKHTRERIVKKKCTLNNHMLGISPRKMKANKLMHSFYKIVGTSRDRKNREFVSIIEARQYPFYAVQWHPERNEEMNAFVKFFSKELRKSKKPIYTRKHYRKFKNLHTKKVDCMNYSHGLYKKCNFYWHNRTSAHNKNLCSSAQLRDKDPNVGGI